MFRFEKIIVAKSWIGSKFETQHVVLVGELRPKSSESWHSGQGLSIGIKSCKIQNGKYEIQNTKYKIQIYKIQRVPNAGTSEGVGLSQSESNQA